MTTKREPVAFQVCECGKHGRFVFPDGRTGPEFESKEEVRTALHYICLVHGFQKVDIFEKNSANTEAVWIKILEMIDNSSLPEKIEYGDKAIRTWNTAKAHHQALDPADFHGVEKRLYRFNLSDPDTY